ncbi:hypothetical protein ACFUC1_06790 [Pedococcus sp. NPDC057267]|uniref:hypothetical protein n=1 Tax=Pedococcus sp. NPDC057267 TaxID=3346077 RepID=UPI003628F466
MPTGVVVDDVVDVVVELVDDVEVGKVLEDVELVLEVDELELVDEVVLDVDEVVVVGWWCLRGGGVVRRACAADRSFGWATAAATPRVGTVSAAMTPSTMPYLGTETVLMEKPHDLPARRRLAPRPGRRAEEARDSPTLGEVRPELSSAR